MTPTNDYQTGPVPVLMEIANANTDHLASALTQLKRYSSWKVIPYPHPDITVANQDKLGIKIEAVRDLIANSAYQPYQAPERVVLLLHLDQATQPAQQALLKLLEEPPKYFRIIATTSRPEAILPTIHSRMERVSPPSAASATPAAAESTEATPPITIPINLENPAANTYQDIIALSETYKERDQAIVLLEQCIMQLRNSDQFPDKLTITSSQIILDHLARLYFNDNVRLTLENCFFSIKNRF